MSDLEERFHALCPRKLGKLPCELCPLAVMRLKHIRALGREPTEEEETKSIGCIWAINHQMSGYCYFVYEAKYLPEQGLSDIEIAGLLNLSVPTVKHTAESGIEKIRDADFVADLKEAMGDERIVEDRMESDDNTIYCE